MTFNTEFGQGAMFVNNMTETFIKVTPGQFSIIKKSDPIPIRLGLVGELIETKRITLCLQIVGHQHQLVQV